MSALDEVMVARAALQALIELCADVARVVELEPMPDGRWLYLIETPFMNFPRYVVGTTDEANESPEVLMTCGNLMNARVRFQDEMSAGGVL